MLSHQRLSGAFSALLYDSRRSDSGPAGLAFPCCFRPGADCGFGGGRGTLRKRAYPFDVEWRYNLGARSGFGLPGQIRVAEE